MVSGIFVDLYRLDFQLATHRAIYDFNMIYEFFAVAYPGKNRSPVDIVKANRGITPAAAAALAWVHINI